MTTLLHDNTKHLIEKSRSVAPCLFSARLFWRATASISSTLQPARMWCVTVDCIPLILPFLSMDPSVSWNRWLVTGILWVMSIHIRDTCEELVYQPWTTVFCHWNMADGYEDNVADGLVKAWRWDCLRLESTGTILGGSMDGDKPRQTPFGD